MKSHRVFVYIIPLLVLLSFGMGFTKGRKRPTHSNDKNQITNTQITLDHALIQIDAPENYNKVLAISDVHGMYAPLLTLLKQAQVIDADLHWTAGKSLLVVVGDSIDKGPMSIEVIDLWMRLAQEAPQTGGMVIPLLGNHEAEFLADPSNSKAIELLSELKAKNIPVQEMTDPQYPRGAFLRSLPVAARIGKWIFCHAGFVTQKTLTELANSALTAMQAGDYSASFFIGNQSLLEMKAWWSAGSTTRQQMLHWLSTNGLYGVVFGHQPSALNIVGSLGISTDQHIIKIDNGMAPEAGSHSGNILVFKNPSQMNTSRLPDITGIPLPPVAEAATQ